MAHFYVCLVCDQQGGTLQRLRPAKLYACTKCMTACGGIAIMTAQAESLVERFWLRRKDIVA